MGGVGGNNTIQGEWEYFRKLLARDEEQNPNFSFRLAEKIFYAGAITMVVMVKGLAEQSPEAAEAILEGLMEEAADFSSRVVSETKEGPGDGI